MNDWGEPLQSGKAWERKEGTEENGRKALKSKSIFLFSFTNVFSFSLFITSCWTKPEEFQSTDKLLRKNDL